MKVITPVRVYLIGPAAARHLITGVNGILFPQMFAAADYFPIVKIVPLWVWIALVLGVGLANLLGGVLGSYRFARIGLIGSAAGTFVVGFGVAIGSTAAAVTGDPRVLNSLYPEISALAIALAAADYVVLTFRWRPDPTPVLTIPDRT